MVLVIVYVGAVAVLFLFVVMMLDVNFDQMREGVQRYAPIGAAVGAVLFLELIVTVAGWQFVPATRLCTSPSAACLSGVTNTTALGRVIYTDYVFLFQCRRVDPDGGDDRRDRADASGAGWRVAQARASASAAGPHHVRNTLEMMTVAIGAGSRQTGILRPLPPPAPPSDDDHDDHGHGHGGSR